MNPRSKTEKREIILCLGNGLNKNGWNDVGAILTRHGHTFQEWQVGEAINGEAELGIILNYDRIVSEEILGIPRCGFVVFHSSNLPEGRGWAPIYYTMTGRNELVQTLLFASAAVDAGRIIAKARYPLQKSELDSEVRAIDDRLSLLLLDTCIDAVLSGKCVGKHQDECQATWWPRRRPRDSQVDPAKPIGELFDQLRALPACAPAFFNHRGRRYRMTLAVDSEPIEFDPKKARIEKYF